MTTVKMLKPYLIPLFGWLPQGSVVTIPDDVANAMVVNRYAEYIAADQPAARWPHKAGRVKINFDVEPPEVTETTGAGGND